MEHGVLEANVTIEQDRCIGERLAQGLKADSYASALAELKLVFVVGGELPFGDRIQDICAALAIAISMVSFTDLAERKDVCEQAEKMIEAAIAENTHIASSLCGWPKGRKIVEDLKQMNRKITRTIEMVKFADTTCSPIKDLFDGLGKI